jgi:hypothetical protein
MSLFILLTRIAVTEDKAIVERPIYLDPTAIFTVESEVWHIDSRAIRVTRIEAAKHMIGHTLHVHETVDVVISKAEAAVAEARHITSVHTRDAHTETAERMIKKIKPRE